MGRLMEMKTQNEVNPSLGHGFIDFSLPARSIRQAGAPVMLALGAAVVGSRLGALVMDLLSQGKGVVLVAMVLTMLLSLLPLLWGSSWIETRSLWA